MVILSEYAWAMGGIVQVVLACIGKVRLAEPARLGGPNSPVNPWPPRVYTIRQGVITTKTRGLGMEVASFSACAGCQYSGACQLLRGTSSRTTCAGNAAGKRRRSATARHRFCAVIGSSFLELGLLPTRAVYGIFLIVVNA